MGQKVSPVGFRVGINRDWSSRWYADKKEFANLLHEDIKIRDLITTKLKNAYVAKVDIEIRHTDAFGIKKTLKK